MSATFSPVVTAGTLSPGVYIPLDELHPDESPQDPNDPNNPGPIDVTDWIVRYIQTHANLYKASGHELTNTGDVSSTDQYQLATTVPQDGKLRPHGATASPVLTGLRHMMTVGG